MVTPAMYDLERTVRGFASNLIDTLDKLADEFVELEAYQPVADDTFTLNPRGYFVYTLWGKDNERLYIGQSGNVLSRLGQHMTNKERQPHIRRVTLERCSSRIKALELEAVRIAQYSPPWNTVRPKLPDSPIGDILHGRLEAEAQERALQAARLVSTGDRY